MLIPDAWRRGRVAEGGGLLNRYRALKPYRGFESLRLRQFYYSKMPRVILPPHKSPCDAGFGSFLCVPRSVGGFAVIFALML